MTAKTDRLLPNFDDSDSGDLVCDACGISFHDGQTYENHMQGKKHQKKVAEARLKAKEKEAAKSPENEEDEEDSDNEMHCEVCNKYFSGYIPYTVHMKSGQHAKTTNKQKLKEMYKGMNDVLADDDEVHDSDGDGIIPKPFARCKMCQKEFSGPENYKKHLNSAVHKKKEKQQKAMQGLKTDHPEEAGKSDDESVFGKCPVCDKSFSGIIPYQIHIQSNVHKRNIERKKVGEELKEFWIDDETEPGYVCRECKKVFLDPLAFKSHQANNSHEKQKAKAALLGFLREHPEIVFATAFEENDSKVECEEEESNYFLICKLCGFSFSGPKAAKDHVKSKKHLSLKKEKKMQKELKMQTTGKSDGKSGDKVAVNVTPDVKDEFKNEEDFEMI